MNTTQQTQGVKESRSVRFGFLDRKRLYCGAVSAHLGPVHVDVAWVAEIWRNDQKGSQSRDAERLVRHYLQNEVKGRAAKGVLPAGVLAAALVWAHWPGVKVIQLP